MPLDRFTLTPTQQQVLAHARACDVTRAVMPPASGKTFLLAGLVAEALAAWRRVLVRQPFGHRGQVLFLDAVSRFARADGHDVAALSVPGMLCWGTSADGESWGVRCFDLIVEDECWLGGGGWRRPETKRLVCLGSLPEDTLVFPGGAGTPGVFDNPSVVAGMRSPDPVRPAARPGSIAGAWTDPRRLCDQMLQAPPVAPPVCPEEDEADPFVTVVESPQPPR